MMPLMRAEGIVRQGDCFLVQCDIEESFYRFPGGTVEFGETAAEAVARELQEEFGLTARAGALAAVSERYFDYGGRRHHQVTLLHWCDLTSSCPNEIGHREAPDAKVVWRTIDQLRKQMVVPEGILDVLASRQFTHLTRGFEGEL
jgi:8-oxo-dGTP diphosphatase